MGLKPYVEILVYIIKCTPNVVYVQLKSDQYGIETAWDAAYSISRIAAYMRDVADAG